MTSSLTQQERPDPAAARRRAGEGETERVAVTVLGSHRSGTSAITRLVSLLGADLPDTLMPGREGNRRGHWEPEPIVELNDELLSSGSSSWDDVSPFPASWYGSPPEAAFRERAVGLLREEYGESPLFVLKDPRISRIVPFWISALEEHGASPGFVIPVRNPLEVAASLRARDSHALSKGLLLWLRYMLDAEHDTRGFPRAFVSFTRLLEDWEAQVELISDRLQLSWPSLSHSSRAAIDAFLVEGERHKRFSAAELENHPAAVAWVKTCYEALERACETGDTPSTELLAEIAGQVGQADRAYGPLLANTQQVSNGRREKIEGLLEARREHDSEVERLGGLSADLQAEVDVRRMRAEIAQREIARRERELSARLAEIGQLRGDLEALATSTEESDAEVERLIGELARSRARAEEIDGGLAKDRIELERRQEEIVRITAELASGKSVIVRLKGDITAREDDLGQSRTELKGLRSRLAERDRKIAVLERGTAEEARERQRQEAEIAARQAEHARQREQQRAEAERLSGELAASEARGGELRAALKASAAEVAGLAAQVESLDSQLERLAGELESFRKRSAASHEEAALTYLAARPPGRLRTNVRLLGWTLWPTTWSKARAFRLIRSSGRFDEAFYLVSYPDAASSGRHPIAHYLERGAGEGKDPSPDFGTSEYLTQHPDLEESGENPFVHFLRNAGTGERDR